VKKLIFFLTLTLCAHNSAAALDAMNSYLEQLAMDGNTLSSKNILNVVTQTIAICDHDLQPLPRAQDIIKEIVTGLTLPPNSGLPAIAQLLATLTLKSPSTVDVLYALTRLAVTITHLHDTDDAAAGAVEATIKALLELRAEKEKKAFIFWISIGLGTAVAAYTLKKIYDYAVNKDSQLNTQLERAYQLLINQSKKAPSIHVTLSQTTPTEAMQRPELNAAVPSTPPSTPPATSNQELALIAETPSNLAASLPAPMPTTPTDQMVLTTPPPPTKQPSLVDEPNGYKKFVCWATEILGLWPARRPATLGGVAQAVMTH
jgi:hypothetical protein